MKDEVLMIRITEEMKTKLKEEAEKKGLSSSTLVRILISNYFEKGGLWNESTNS